MLKAAAGPVGTVTLTAYAGPMEGRSSLLRQWWPRER
jgi:hypothetical protein